MGKGQKSHSGAGKRLRVTGGGKIKRKRSNHRHLLTTGKSRKQKNRLQTTGYVAPGDLKRVRALLSA